ncbi:MAG: sulfite exporter TauE/SafE family protein [Clostridiaceae bacterium]|nr:sulfite exporter TauE/SafE family protein [Clostridiaceae bacterium]
MEVLASFGQAVSSIPTNIWIFILVGFFAQTIDGTLGMAYGVSCNSFLLTFGVPPALASASVHMAEVFTTLVSGISHWKLKNINKGIFFKLLIPGIIGGAVGAYILTSFDGNTVKPYINGYLVVMGIIIIVKIFRKQKPKNLNGWIYPLGLSGGLLDAIGGGGWGPVVTSTLIASGVEPRYTIGTVNAAEFFVTLAESIMFISFLGLEQSMYAIIGLIIGGVIAAPFGAFLVKRLPMKPLMALVGALIIFLNIKSLIGYIIG